MPDSTAGAAVTPPRRTVRVRRRLVIAVAVVATTVLGAGAPGIIDASRDLTQSQDLVTLSQLNGQAVVLAHALADERDAMTEYVASGRSAASGAGVSESRAARVDRQAAEIRPHAPAGLRRLLDELPEVRRQALSGSGSALDTHESYTGAVQALHAVAADLARKLPARAETGGSGAALPSLGRGVEQASGTRALLLAALSGGGSQPRLTALAQRTSVQEQAALADFDQSATQRIRDAYTRTVNGAEATAAERYLARLTDQPQLSGSDLGLDRARVEAALSGRIDRMRAVESSLTIAETARLAKLRDDDVTALELRAGLLAACLLIAVGVGMSAARSMTRPLAVLRLGARRLADDPVAQEPVAFTGRNDEFAETVRAINELRETAVRLHERAEGLGSDRIGLVGERDRLAAERATLQRQQQDLTERLAAVQHRAHSSFVSLALRTLALVERQLGIIEGLEDREQDPDRLGTLFKLDHLATRMRRHSENLLVLAGAEHGGGHPDPVPLIDVLRASISEIERYDRVQIQSLPPHAQVAGFAADDVSHLIAELLENATLFSPPDADVQLSGWLLESGDVMLSVQDDGIGMTAERLAEINARMADPDPDGGEDEDAVGLGLYVVARLAARHGVRVRLREQKQGGVTAVAVLPKAILPAKAAGAGLAPSPDPAASPAALRQPGSTAEVNSHALPPRRPDSLPRRGAPVRTAEATPPGRGAEAGAPGPEARTGSAGTGPVTAGPTPVGREHPREPADSVPADSVPAVPAETAAPAAAHRSDPVVAAAEQAIEAAAHNAPAHLADRAAAAKPGLPTRPLPADTGRAGWRPAPYGDGLTGQPTGAVQPTGTGSFGTRPYEPEPDAHERAEDTGRLGDPGTGIAPAAGSTPASGDGVPGATPPATGTTAATGEEGSPGGGPRWEHVTDKGLPKRTPRVTAPSAAPAPERRRAVDAEALRRRLGGFQRGARDGRRDAKAEIVERTGEHHTEAPAADGGTVEEARG